jgi:hypothetical protein
MYSGILIEEINKKCPACFLLHSIELNRENNIGLVECVKCKTPFFAKRDGSLVGVKYLGAFKKEK